MVPGAPDASDGERPRRALLWWGIGAVVAIVASVLIAASLIKVGYVVISPGRAYPTNDRVSLGGGQQPFTPGGVIDFVTVSEKVDVTALEKVIAERDPDAQVSPAKQELGGRSPKEDAALNLLLMRSSKDTAAFVALSKIGYAVPTESLGAVVTEISPGSPASAAGLLPGDSITAIDGAAIASSQALRDAVAAHRSGDHVTFTVMQAQGDPRAVAVALADKPDSAGVGFLGVGTTDLVIPDLPFPVTLRTDDVGGPSAGLAFTLAIIDLLTPGELTGGGAVAVTGTISADGTVGPIGGIEQKVVTVERSDDHPQLFLVPADNNCGQPNGSCNFSDASRKAGGKLKVVAVKTLDDALTAMAQLGGNGLALGTPGAAVSDSSPS
ncbi:MAG: YlbL family protein [Acidimicrobiales bacterium]